MSDKEKYILQQITNTIKSKDTNAKIILFGSHARGTAHSDSDWDILIILNRDKVSLQTEQELRHSLIDVELEVGEVISAFIYSKNDWENKFKITPFYKNVIREGKNLA